MFEAETLNAAVDLIMWLIVTLAMLLLYRSVPADKIAEGIQIAKTGASKTPTAIDDKLVDLVEQLYLALAAQRDESAKNGVSEAEPVRDKPDADPL